MAFVRPRLEHLVCPDWRDTRLCRVHALPARSCVSPKGTPEVSAPLTVGGGCCPCWFRHLRLACPVSPEKGQGSGSPEGVGSFPRTLVLWRQWQPWPSRDRRQGELVVVLTCGPGLLPS